MATPAPVASNSQTGVVATPTTPVPPSTTPALAPTPTAAASTSTAAAVALGNARDALDHGYLIQPAGKNAVDLSLAAWELALGTPDSRKLVDDVLRSLSVQEAQAIAQRNDQRAGDLKQKASVLDNATVGPTAQGLEVAARVCQKRHHDRAKKLEAADLAGLARTQALASQLGVQTDPTVASPIGSAQMPAASNPGKPATGTSGVTLPPASSGMPATNNGAAADPGFVKIHDQIGIFPPAAISRTEVTRRDYAAFVSATHHATADCSSAKAERNNEQSAAVGLGPATGPLRPGRSRQSGRWSRGLEPPERVGCAGPDTGGSQKNWTDPDICAEQRPPCRVHQLE